MYDMNNKKLFWYGWRAKIKKSFGVFLIITGLFLLLVHWILTIIAIGIGIYFIATGSSQRFDYQRQSGSIIHGGDNFR